MLKRTFRYCATHKEDEAYMQAMCAQGWAALRLVEGVWIFEPCQPGQYCYRVGYLRGMSRREAEGFAARLAGQGIELVSRYSFWAIFRSKEPFRLYTPAEERALCRKIYAPMPVGAVLSWGLCLLGAVLACKASAWWLLLAVPAGAYAGVCTWLAAAYHRLLKQLP